MIVALRVNLKLCLAPWIRGLSLLSVTTACRSTGAAMGPSEQH